MFKKMKCQFKLKCFFIVLLLNLNRYICIYCILFDDINNYYCPNNSNFNSKYIASKNKIENNNNNNSNSNSLITNNKNVKVTLCTIGRDENLYIREWVKWYMDIGVSKIVLYDNNKIDGERFEDVINDYLENGFVNIIDRRGVVKTNEKIGVKEIKEGKSVQAEAYHDCYYNNYKNSDWIFFFDIDEFLSIESKYKNLNEFLNDFNDFDGIRVQWRIYGDNDHLYYENKPVNERFKNKNNYSNTKRLKTILKCKEYKNDLIINCHGLLNKELFFVNLKKIRVKNYLNDSKAYSDLPVYLNHFYSKSTEEYIKRKYKKPDASFGLNKNKNFSVEFIKRQYFQYNKFTKEKNSMFDSLIL